MKLRHREEEYSRHREQPGENEGLSRSFQLWVRLQRQEPRLEESGRASRPREGCRLWLRTSGCWGTWGGHGWIKVQTQRPGPPGGGQEGQGAVGSAAPRAIARRLEGPPGTATWFVHLKTGILGLNSPCTLARDSGLRPLRGSIFFLIPAKAL